jgi:amidophosphoribosyltransferase
MCGIIGSVITGNITNDKNDENDEKNNEKNNEKNEKNNEKNNENLNALPDLYEGLFHLQHRGQDAAGIYALSYNNIPHIIKKEGLLSDLKDDLYQIDDAQCALGHIRYSTCKNELIEPSNQTQPIILSHITLCHNGHITLTPFVIEYYNKVCNANTTINDHISDSYLIANIINEKIKNILSKESTLTSKHIGCIITEICYTINEGAYSIILIVKDFGLIAFKDNYGIRPLSYGTKQNKLLFASESVALYSQNYKNVEEILSTEILIYNLKKKKSKIEKIEKYIKFGCNMTPCIFEWIYLARAESIIYNVPVYNARLKMGEYLARKMLKTIEDTANLLTYDYVIPIPDTSRPYALQISKVLGIPYVEAIIKNRYIYRTFIMDTQEKRRSNLKRKLNVIPSLIKNKNIIIVDDSIVRGNTIRHIIDLLKQTEVNKIIVVSAAPQIININRYGIDVPTREELISYKYNPQELAKLYDIEYVIFQDKQNLFKAIQEYNPDIKDLETSIFEP